MPWRRGACFAPNRAPGLRAEERPTLCFAPARPATPGRPSARATAFVMLFICEKLSILRRLGGINGDQFSPICRPYQRNADRASPSCWPAPSCAGASYGQCASTSQPSSGFLTPSSSCLPSSPTPKTCPGSCPRWQKARIEEATFRPPPPSPPGTPPQPRHCRRRRHPPHPELPPGSACAHPGPVGGRDSGFPLEPGFRRPAATRTLPLLVSAAPALVPTARGDPGAEARSCATGSSTSSPCRTFWPAWPTR